jgi:hypothetical protein
MHSAAQQVCIDNARAICVSASAVPAIDIISGLIPRPA